MYNLTVANDHTYFVGVGGVLGHNAGCEVPQWNGKFGKHLFEGDINGGFHHRGFLSHSKSKVLKIQSRVTRGRWKGAYRAKVKIYPSGQIKNNNSFFPDSWSRSRVIKEVNEAYYDILRKNPNGLFQGYYIGVSKNGYPIKIFIKTRKAGSGYVGRVATAFPDI